MTTPSDGAPGSTPADPLSGEAHVGDAVVRRSRRPRSAHRGRRWMWFAAVLALAAVALGTVALLTAPVPEVAGAPSRGSSSAVATATPLLSARRAPAWTARPVAARNVANAATPALGAFPPDACVVVRDGPVTLVGLNGATPLVPASNMKVLTGAAALAILGPDTRLTTTFRAGAPPVDGVVAGDLWMVGGGDPLLATGTYASTQSSPTPVTSLEAAADSLVSGGLRRVTGSVVGDESRYDTERTRPSWPARFVGDRQVANLSALMVNDAWTVGALEPGPDPGPAPDPALYAATILTDLLRARGVVVDGPPAVGVAPPTSVVLGQATSAPVSDVVTELLTFSDNTTAELLVKEIGRVAGGAGTSDAGLTVMRRWLDEQGLPTAGVVLADGSGLSADNRLTCDLLTALLVRSGPDGTLANGLARPGRPGTLSRRLREDDVRDRVRAKTGSLNSVRSLSGWITTVPGRPLAFAMLANTGARIADESDEAVEEALLRTLLAYPQTPTPAELGPLPAGG